MTCWFHDGRTGDRQVDCLADLGRAIVNGDGGLWRMVNGYALPRPGGLAAASARIAALDAPARDHLRGLLSVGIPAETEVTLNRAGHRVTQAQCSALPAAYGSDPVDAWEPPARLVLEAAHEATFLAALRFGRPARPLFLTLPA